MTNPDRYKQGSDLYGAHLILMNIKCVTMTHKEKQLFWCGYLSAAFGAAIKDLTPDGFGEVINPIMETLESMVNDEEALIAEKQLRAAGAAVEEAPAEVSPLIGFADRLDSVATWMDSQVQVGYGGPGDRPYPVTEFDRDLDERATEVGQISRALRESVA